MQEIRVRIPVRAFFGYFKFFVHLGFDLQAPPFPSTDLYVYSYGAG